MPGERGPHDQIPPGGTVGQIEGRQHRPVEVAPVGGAEQTSGQEHHRLLDRPIEALELGFELVVLGRLHQILPPEADEEASIRWMAPAELDDRTSGAERGRTRVFSSARGQKVLLGAPHGADPEPGEHRVPGSKAVVDRADRRTAGAGYRLDRRAPRALLEQQLPRRVEDRIGAVEGRPRHWPIYVMATRAAAGSVDIVPSEAQGSR